MGLVKIIFLPLVFAFQHNDYGKSTGSYGKGSVNQSVLKGKGGNNHNILALALVFKTATVHLCMMNEPISKTFHWIMGIRKDQELWEKAFHGFWFFDLKRINN
ncbi:hypothetical protein SpiGrapes_3104 [Sphaerochaeta pleomorpha str. Grapes]|uniref:Uncharacterized protein n=1 Tax=Sphaerochaeta pleomorpha (strain ATCC BAA-1885 / DSM 22778 / Grapes) TaxID=158190 RepID=G8QYZ2_SPHPG|nr:hypothetical protein [Sphaerochaeta pleomorpha]AEV30851.1 hypothetical protein SpiGrapes_3104 [Sphaerochaeta pleomorpha str. Grapes]